MISFLFNENDLYWIKFELSVIEKERSNLVTANKNGCKSDPAENR